MKNNFNCLTKEQRKKLLDDMVKKISENEKTEESEQEPTKNDETL